MKSETTHTVLFPATCFVVLMAILGLVPGENHSKRMLSPDSLFVERLLKTDTVHFGKMLAQPGKYKIQIMYTRIDRDENNMPHFTEYGYRISPPNYYYCASLVKLPCAALALEKLNDLKIANLSRDSRMFTDSAGPCQKKVVTDTTAASGFPSLGQYIRRMFLISDNFAYSRIYEFLGPPYIAEKLREKGYPKTYILQRYDPGCKTPDNRITNPIHFEDEQGKVLYAQDAQQDTTLRIHPMGKPLAGKSHIDDKGRKIHAPRDFSHSNYLSLPDITRMLRSIVFPKSVPQASRFHISEADRQFMLRYLCMLPRESDHPKYTIKAYPDNYKKYLLYGAIKDSLQPDTLRVFNIVGESYGFVSDVAYVCDFKNKIEFMLSAVIYANEKEVINGNTYEYNAVAMPWFTALGNLFYRQEKDRTKANLPDLTEFEHVNNKDQR
jgi:hypothetical protein